MSVLTDRALQRKRGPTSTRLPLTAIADLISRHREDMGRSSPVDPRVVATCIAAMSWGLVVLEARWLDGVDLEEIPTEQVATIAQSMLVAGQ